MAEKVKLTIVQPEKALSALMAVIAEGEHGVPVFMTDLDCDVDGVWFCESRAMRDGKAEATPELVDLPPEAFDVRWSCAVPDMDALMSDDEEPCPFALTGKVSRGASKILLVINSFGRTEELIASTQ